MHMADALLSPAVGGAFWAGAIGCISYCSKKLKEAMDDKLIPLMGVMAAFVFAGQMINFTIPGTGSSGHLGGGMLLSAVLGPHAAFLAIASILAVQAVFFADGGLLALGCNIWNLGFYPAFIAYPLIYKPLVVSGAGKGRICFASLVSSVAALQMGAFSVVLQTQLSGRSDLPLGAFVLLMQPVHLAIGIVEGFVTAGVINFVRTVRPEVLGSAAGARPIGGSISLKGLLLAFVLLALVIGGALSWFASARPDGLEWAIEKVYGRPELPENDTAIGGALRDVQEKTALLPDYTFRNDELAQGAEDTGPGEWPSVDKGTSFSGIVGVVMVLALVMLVGRGIRAIRRRGGEGR